MKFFKSAFLVFFILIVAVIYINAQDQITEPAPLSPKKTQCTSDLFNKAEYSFRVRGLRDYSLRAEGYLKKILDVCPNANLMTLWRKRLEILDEEKAEHHFIVANYYLKKFHEKKIGIKGAQVRLREIVEDFPEFSKIDEATFLLAETYFLDENFEEAEKWYQKVIEDFMESEFADIAKSRIKEIKNIGNAR